jgi:septin 7
LPENTGRFPDSGDFKRHKSLDISHAPTPTPTPKLSKSVSITNISVYAATNGPLPAAPSRPSPAPQNSQGPPVPNGKPSAPHVDRSNPMGTNGQIAAQTVSSKDPKAAAQAASDMRNVVRRKLTGYVGFANLPNQWHRKSVRKGFNFNVMVVGKFDILNYMNGCVLTR